jgi:hypothetical protein
MTRQEAVRLWDEVQVNQHVLAACVPPHDFVQVDPKKGIGGNYRCSKCGGEVENLHRVWYEQGLADGQPKPHQKN